ncbi:hypothetical protein B5X24_HaOG210646 [Helicoverpa armigera]|nr:hypothetical protein B5X24_HaOG210646 [Helicoverpa armigera]
MRRPCNRKVLTADEKVKFLLKHGHMLKEKFIAKPPVNVKPPPPIKTPGVSKKKHNSNHPMIAKSGHLKKNAKCNMKLVGNILKNELMINDRTAKNGANGAVLRSPLPVGVNNNNDTAITDQNSTFHEFSDEECKLSGDVSAASNEVSDEEECSDNLEGKDANKSKNAKKAAQLDVHEKTCTAGTTAKPEPKGKKKKSIKGDDEIEVEASMSLSRMRFLLALLLTMIATKEKLKYLGFNKRLVDEILVESLEAMSQTPCKDESLPPVKRLRKNIETLLIGTVPKDQMENFKKENKSTEDILELLTNEKEK